MLLTGEQRLAFMRRRIERAEKTPMMWAATREAYVYGLLILVEATFGVTGEAIAAMRLHQPETAKALEARLNCILRAAQEHPSCGFDDDWARSVVTDIRNYATLLETTFGAPPA